MKLNTDYITISIHEGSKTAHRVSSFTHHVSREPTTNSKTNNNVGRLKKKLNYGIQVMQGGHELKYLSDGKMYVCQDKTVENASLQLC